MRPAIGSARLLASLLLALISVQNAMAAPGDLLSTDKTNVNVRVSPSTDAGIVTRLAPGETAIEIGTLDDWYRIRLP
ncbi:MAG: SH3 domain-containing protein, partial [Geminicoccaceae bacterium]